jgi:hypothetical protein
LAKKREPGANSTPSLTASSSILVEENPSGRVSYKNSPPRGTEKMA